MILGIGSSFRLYKLDEKSLWSDEVATIATSMGNSIDPVAFSLKGKNFDPPEPVVAASYLGKATYSHGAGNFAQTAEVLKSNVHPPLFFWLMNVWIHTFGLSADTLRLPAAILGILTIPVMYWLALKIADLDRSRFSANARQGFALWSAAIMAFSAYQVDHAQDARQYTLLIILAMFAVGLAIKLQVNLDSHHNQSKSFWTWVGLGIVLAAGLYSQYFFAGFAFFILAYLTWLGRKDKRFLLYVAGTGLLIALLLLPWWSVFKEQLTFLKSAGHYTAGLWRPLQLPEKLWRIACEFLMPDHPLGKVLPLLIGLVSLGIWQLKRGNNVGDNPLNRQCITSGLVFILLWLLAVVGGQILIDLLKQSHTATIRRYLFLASPACYLLMAYGLISIAHYLKSRMGWAISALLGTLLLGFMIQDTTNMLRYEHTSSDEFKQAASLINRFRHPSDIVLVSKSGAMAVGMAYYLKPDTQMRGIHVADYSVLQNGSPLMDQLQDILEQHTQSRIWLVLSHEAPSTRERLSAWLLEQGYQQKAFEKFPGVRLILWQRG